MENTKKVLFGDKDEAIWFVAVGESWIGPLKRQEIFDKIKHGGISHAHFAWQKGQREWRRICDIKQLSQLDPPKPKQDVMKEVRSVTRSRKVTPPEKPNKRKRGTGIFKRKKLKKIKRQWFLYYDESQIGPFATDEIRRYVSIGKLQAKDLVWKYGMKDWDVLENLEDFSDALKEGKNKLKKIPRKARVQHTSEKRREPRKPLVARAILTDDKVVSVGVCRDLSVGGMQVLTEKVPGKVGARVKVNVSPTEPGAIEPFVAIGVIVRILDDGLGFSFRFEEIEDRSLRAIEKYVHE